MMDALVSGWGRIAWAQCWQVTLLIAGVWLVLLACGRNRPHLACALWLVVLVKCVTPPLVSSPSGIFCWLQRTERTTDGVEAAAPEISAASSAAGLARASTTGDEDDTVVVQTLRKPPASAAPALPSPGAYESPVTVATDAAPLRLWSWSSLVRIAAAVWLAGAVTFAAVAVRRWRACWNKLQAARELCDPALAMLLDDLCRRLKVKRRVRLLVTETSLGPAVVGLWRPVVILPAAIVRGKSPAELAPLLAHELIHIRRGDLWIGLLQTLAIGLWWFHPLVRLASRLITREAERCCDEETIAHLGCEPPTYARSLLDVLALKQQLTPIPAFPGVRSVDVTSQRLERIMRLGQGCHKRTPWWCWLATIFLAAAVLPGAALVVGGEDEPQEKVPFPDDFLVSKPQAPLSRNPKEAAFARWYDVTRLITDLKTERGYSEAGARSFVTDLIRSVAPGTDSLKLEKGKRLRETSDGVVQVEEQVAMLTVLQTAEGHRRIADQLATFREHGFADVAVEVRIVSGPAAVLKIDRVDWRMIGGSEAGAPSLPNEQAAQPELQPAGTAQVRLVDDVAVGARLGTAVSVVERSVPAMVALLDEEQAKEILTAAQAHPKTNVVSAPKVTVFSGQWARVEDAVQRPFVVGVTPVRDGEKTVLHPTIRVVSEGTSIRLRPVAEKNGQIRLDFGLTLSQIRDVDTAELPAGPGKEPITVQVPEVASMRLNTTVEMNAEQTMVLSVPKMGKGKKEQQPLCVLVKVSRINNENSAQESPATQRPNDAANSEKPNGLFEFVVSGWRLKSAGDDWGPLSVDKADGKSVLRELTIRGNVRLEAVLETTEGMPSHRIVAQAKTVQIFTQPENGDSAAKLTISLDGDVRLRHNESRIEAKQVLLRWGDSKNKAPQVQIELHDAKSVDLRSRYESADEVELFPRALVQPVVAFVEKVYPVADTVIPVPSGPIIVSATGTVVKRETPSLDKPDFDSLIDLITTTIKPSSWERSGGRGRITTATNSLSLVIRQEERVHQEIADLLGQLRRLQDIQVLLTLERLDFDSSAELEESAAKESNQALRPIAENPRSRVWHLSSVELQNLKRVGRLTALPPLRVTAFAGQSVELRFDDPNQEPKGVLSQLEILPIVKADFRSIRLEFRACVEGSDRDHPSEKVEFARGRSVLVDLSEFAWQEREQGVPVLDKLPHTARLFTKVSAKKPETRHFYLITPQVLVATEEETGRVLVPRKE